MVVLVVVVVVDVSVAVDYKKGMHGWWLVEGTVE